MAENVSPPTPPARPVARVVAIVVGGTALLAAVAWGLGRVVADARANAAVVLAPEWILVGGGLWTLALPFQALRWRALLPGPPAPAGPLSVVVVGANLLNIVLPGPAGELAAGWIVHRRWGVPLLVAMGSSLLARVLALVVLGALLLAGAPLLHAPPDWVRVGVVAVGAGALGLASVWIWPAGIRRGVGVVARVLPPRLAERLDARARWWEETVGALGHLGARRWIEAAGWSAASALTLGVATVAAFRGASVDAAAVPVLYTHVLASLVNLASLVLPGGLGAVEAVWVGVLPTIDGVSAVEAAFGALAVRQVQLVSMLVSLPALLWVTRETSRVG